MRTIQERKEILELHNQGLNNCQISRRLNIPRVTIRDIIKCRGISKMSNRFLKSTKILQSIQMPITKNDYKLVKEYSYFLGMFLGDGCLSKMPNKINVYHLRISQDAKYPILIDNIRKNVSKLFPDNSVSLVRRLRNGKPSCVDVSCYSTLLTQFLPFYKPGKKHTYKINLKDWQKSIIEKYPHEFWLGLFHSDGSRYLSSGRACYNFTQKSTDILNLFLWACDLIGAKYTTHFKKKTQCTRVDFYRREVVAFLDTFAGPKT